MTLPPIAVQAGAHSASGVGFGVGWSAVKRPMNASAVMVFCEFVHLALKVTGNPERGEVAEPPADHPDKPFDERLRERHIRPRRYG